MSSTTEALGASEQALREARVRKAESVRARGGDPFSNDIEPASIVDLGTLRRHFQSVSGEDGSYEAAKVEAQADSMPWGAEVTVAGRVMADRSFGKATFLRMRDWAGELQVFCRKDVLGAGYDLLAEIDVADHVLAKGRMTATKKGELSIEPRELRLLTKAFRPLPDKWHGLSDVELRVRRRYLDLIANEEVRAIFRGRSIIVRALRQFLDDRGFLEVETPTMTTLVGGAAAKPFRTHHNALDLDLVLRIAPELYLKRLVVGGLERVYEIGRCYRNEGLSTRHNPEFTMLEFYMAYARYETLMDLTEEMLRHVDAVLREAMPKEHAVWAAKRSFCLDAPFVRRPMGELIEMVLANEPGSDPTERVLRAAGLRASMWDQPVLLAEVWEAACAAGSGLGAATVKQLRACESHGERVFLLYELFVEPRLCELFAHEGKSVPVFVMDHPSDVSPLARRHSRAGRDASTAQRFELFVHSRELCNAFSELNDPEEQAARFREQVQKKARGAEETMDYDEDYVCALEHGLPPTAGFGMGVDRLTMMLTATDSIREVILFPLLRPER